MAAKTLYDIIFTNIEDELKNIKRIYLNGVAPLNEIPFSLLVTDLPNDTKNYDSGDYSMLKWFINEYAISYIPSVQSLELIKANYSYSPRKYNWLWEFFSKAQGTLRRLTVVNVLNTESALSVLIAFSQASLKPKEN